MSASRKRKRNGASRQNALRASAIENKKLSELVASQIKELQDAVAKVQKERDQKAQDPMHGALEDDHAKQPTLLERKQLRKAVDTMTVRALAMQGLAHKLQEQQQHIDQAATAGQRKINRLRTTTLQTLNRAKKKLARQ